MSENILQLTQDIGFREQAAKGVDPVTSGDLIFYKFGLYTTSWGKFPTLTSDIALHYRGNQFNPYSQRVSKTSVAGLVSFTWTNGLPFYMIMAKNGSGVVHAAGTFRIDGITSSFLNNFVIPYRSDNDQDRIQRRCIDSKISRLTLSIDFDQPDLPMAGSINHQSTSMRAIASGSGAAVSSQAGNANEFYPDDNMKLLWDVNLDSNGQYEVGGTDLDLKPYLMEYTITIDVTSRPARITTQHFPTQIVNGYRLFGYHMKIRRTDETSIFDHYVGTTVDGTVPNDDSQAGKSYAGSAAFKNSHFKIFALDSNDAEGVNFIQVDLKENSIGTMEMNHVDETGEEEAYYEFNGFATQGIPTTKDEVAAALYGTT